MNLTSLHSKYPFLLPTLVMLAVTFLVYGKVLLHPGDFCFSSSNDSLKNYYSLAWYIDHESKLEFGGMKYPHEGSYMYTDGHPPVGMLFSALGLSGSQGIAFINWAMIISFPLSWLLFMLFFKRSGMSLLWSFLAAFSLVCITPQLDRMDGHFALAYMFFFPLTFLFLQSLYRGNFRAVAGLIVSSTVAIFLHPYLGFLMCFITAGVIPWFLVRSRSTARWKSLFWLVVSTAVPLLIWKGVVTASDPVANRPNDPSGFLECLTTWGSLLLPRHDWPGILPLNHVDHPAKWEGICYVGLGFYVLVALYSISGIRQIRTQRPALKWLLLALPGIVALTLALGYPFIVKPEWVEHAGPLKQFRALGRFSWVFLYMGIAGAFILISRLDDWKRPWLHGAAWLSVGLFVLEGGYAHVLKAQNITANHNFFSTDDQLAFSNTEAFAKFVETEAIIPLPMYFIGSDTYNTDLSPELFGECLKYSYYTGIPTAANSTSREPVIPTAESITLGAPSFYPKKIMDEMNPDYSLVTVLYHQDYFNQTAFPAVSHSGTMILQSGPWIFAQVAKSDMHLQPIPLDSALVSQLDNCGDTLIQIAPSPPYSFHFPHSGIAPDGPYNFIGSIVDSSYANKQATFSCWVHNGLNESHPGAILVQEVTPEDQVNWLVHKPLIYANILSGDSTRLEFDFTFPPEGSKLDLFYLDRPDHPNRICVNHVQVREKGDFVLEKKNGLIFLNNHPAMKVDSEGLKVVVETPEQN